MSVIVQKYGGSSVADLTRIGRVADRVVAARQDGHEVVVVVSAMGKTTDQLLAMAREVSGTPPRRELDMLLSVGERITMALLAIALQQRGADAISFTGSQSGILTNDRHFDARIIEVRPYRIEDELARGRVVIVAGYQGMSYRREITTLGRGGSDTTAVALAAALRADRCEIYSDVDGVYTADPRVVPGARHLPALGYVELQEMAESGAKVLNAEAVAFAKRERIQIHARRTDDAHGAAGARETVVRAEVAPSPRRVRAVVGDADVAWVRGAADHPAGFDGLLALAAEAGVPLRAAEWTSAGASAWVSLPRVPDWDRAAAALASAGLTVLDPRSTDAVACVSVVGDGLTEDGGVLRDVLSVARAEGCAPRSVSSTPFRITLAVARASADPLTRALHGRFCEG
jgi:aspartate kinase